jgi:hypothetical protein
MSPGDPDRPNWIDMGGILEGLFSYRYILVGSNPKPSVESVHIRRGAIHALAR